MLTTQLSLSRFPVKMFKIRFVIASLVGTVSISLSLGYAYSQNNMNKRLGEFNVYRQDGSNDRFTSLGTNDTRKYDEPKKGYFCEIVDGKLWRRAIHEIPVNREGEYMDKEGRKYKLES
jgi:hypothetical protein